MVEIQLSEEFLKEFSKIERRAERGNGEARYLLKIIDKGIAKLSMDIHSGQEIQHHLWPERYRANRDITNLWRLRLDSSWRMLYTARGNQVRIVAFVLGVVDHKRYGRMFGYQ